MRKLLLCHFLQENFNITPNSTADYKTSAVEAPRLAGRYSSLSSTPCSTSAVEAPRLAGRYSGRIEDLKFKIEDLVWMRYSKLENVFTTVQAVEALDWRVGTACFLRLALKFVL
jgi:hypothetical protein